MKSVSNQSVAILAISLAVATTFGAFYLSRSDHDLKLMSLQAVLTLGGSLIGIAGTLLVGVQAYRQLVSGDLPPGSSAREETTSTVQIPPVAESVNTPKP